MRIVLTIAALLYAASGLYLVRGDESAVLRRFGRHSPPLRQGGLHYDLPWPFARVDRVPRQSIRTLTLGLPADAMAARPGFGASDSPGADPLVFGIDRQAEYLTGDKNILNLQLTVQYVVEAPDRWLFDAIAPEVALKRLAEAELTSLAAECGVDFVQLSGLAEFQQTALERLRRAATSRDWGVSIEDAAIGHATPPVEVKAAFLDVSNARAERDQTISKERARGESQVAQARSNASGLLDRAASERQSRVEMARADESRLRVLLDELQAVSAPSEPAPSGTAAATRLPPAELAARRQRLMRRMFVEFVETTFPKLGRVMFLDPGQATDLVLPPAAPEPATDR
jgi:membrane protease subunit HflK